MGLGISARIVNVPSLDEAKEMLKVYQVRFVFQNSDFPRTNWKQ